MNTPNGPRMDFLWYATGPFLCGPHSLTNRVCGPEDLKVCEKIDQEREESLESLELRVHKQIMVFLMTSNMACIKNIEPISFNIG